jgi:hypothetical protein
VRQPARFVIVLSVLVVAVVIVSTALDWPAVLIALAAVGLAGGFGLRYARSREG